MEHSVVLYFHRFNNDKLRCFWYTTCIKSFQTANASSLLDLKRAKKVSSLKMPTSNSHCSEIDKPLTLCNRYLKLLVEVVT